MRGPSLASTSSVRSAPARTGSLFQQANGTFAAEPARPAGFDLSVPITQTINFVGTLHPDFSNVEIDQETIAPQEFRRQVLEYRPFFSQGRELS